jgi:hypothetical protein
MNKLAVVNLGKESDLSESLKKFFGLAHIKRFTIYPPKKETPKDIIIISIGRILKQK